MLSEFLRLENIVKKYQANNGEVLSVDNVSFNLKQGEFISIIGPSGCGKSTILSIIAGLEKATHGNVYIQNEKVLGLNSKIAYMLQSHNLLEWRNVYKNILLGLEIQHKYTKENLEYVNRLIKTYGLEEFRQSYPSQLSGGMKQRVALIRTLAIKPELLLLDEAFSALDYQTRLQVTEDVRNILTKEHKTTIMVTHDIPESISMSDRIIVLTKRPAKIRAIHKLDFNGCNSPLKRRAHSNFTKYFNMLWGEMVE